MNLELRKRLVDAAHVGEVVSDSELEKMLKLDMDNRTIGSASANTWARSLGSRSRRADRCSRASVWHKDMSGPGRGFFDLAVELGYANGADDEMAVAVRELKRTYQYWSKH